MRGACCRHVGVTNFDVPRLKEIVDSGVRIVSNQVLCSLPGVCEQHNRIACTLFKRPRTPGSGASLHVSTCNTC